MDHLALLVDEEFCEVPGNNLGLLFVGIPQRTIRAQESVNRVCVGPVHIDLCEEGELGVITITRKGLDFGLVARFLVHKLIAGEGENLESSLAILRVKLHHLTVVLVGQTSVRRHVDDHDALFALNDFAEALNVPAVNVLRANLK